MSAPVPVGASHEGSYIAILYSDGKTICKFNMDEALEELKAAGLKMRGKKAFPLDEDDE